MSLLLIAHLLRQILICQLDYITNSYKNQGYRPVYTFVEKKNNHHKMIAQGRGKKILSAPPKGNKGNHHKMIARGREERI